MITGEPDWLVTLGPRGVDLRPSAGVGRPVTAEAHGVLAILDGELADRELLRRGVGRDLPGDTRTDAALVLAAYLEAGERILPLLRGSFGLIVWDPRTETLRCVRDPNDSHPLFYARSGETLVVAASHGALLGAGVDPELHRLAIARWVVQGSILPRRTFYDRIQRLPPGHMLTATTGRLRVDRYWHPREHAPAPPASGHEAVIRLQELLDQAVARCADRGPLGIFLSGGVDSTIVAASAAQVARTRGLPDPVALSYVYPDPAASEETAQRSIARALGLPHRVVPLLDTVGEEGLLRAALDTCGRAWMPFVNPWEPGFLQLAREGAEMGCRVILSGEGGNDWMDANWFEAADLMRHARLLELARLWSAERRGGRSARDVTGSLLWTFGARPLLRDAALATARVAAGATFVRRVRARRTLASIRAEWAVPDTALRAALVDDLLAGKPDPHPRSYADRSRDGVLDGAHLVVPMENRFLFSKELGVSFANPALDPDLVAFLQGLPTRVLNLNGRGKGLAWAAARDRVGPRAAALLGLAELDGFMSRLIGAGAERTVGELGGLTRLSELGVVDRRAFLAALRVPGSGPGPTPYQVWQVLACEAWLR